MSLLDNIKKWARTVSGADKPKDDYNDLPDRVARILGQQEPSSKNTSSTWLPRKEVQGPSPSAVPSPTAKPMSKDYYSKVPNDKARDLLKKYAEKYGVDPKFAIAVAGHESAGTFDPTIKSYNGDGGRGLLQITPYLIDPRTGKAKVGKDGKKIVNNQYGASVVESGKWDDPEALTDAGMRTLADSLAKARVRFGNDPDPTRQLRDAYMMFNAGPTYYKAPASNIETYRGRAKKVIDRYNELEK